MQFRQQRRRRVFSDEVAQQGADADDSSGDSTTGGRRRETYTSQARREEQPRLTDLVPTRRRVLALWYAAGVGVVGLVEVLHARLDWIAAQVAPAVPRVFDLAERSSLGAWCSSAWLSITALVSVLLYSLRRHRIDDYRGRYRVWIWAALVWLALAVNQTAPWDELLRELTMNTAARVGLTQAWLWPMLCGGMAVLAAVRLSIEMRDSLLSLALLWLGGLAWFGALVCPGLVSGSLEPASVTMLAAGMALVGQWTILSAHVAYARHVLLDAHGLIAPRESTGRPRLARRGKAEGKSEADAAPSQRQAAASAKTTVAATSKPAATGKPATTAPAGTQRATAPPAAKPVQPAKTQASRGAAVASSQLNVVDDDEDEDDSSRQVSRAERKRSKRQQRGQFRDAA